MAKQKECSRCSKKKSVDDFPKDKKQHDGKSTWCKQCWKDYRVEKAGGSKTTKKAKSVKQAKAEKKTAAKSKKVSKPVLAKSSDHIKVTKPDGVVIRTLSALKDLPSKFKLFSFTAKPGSDISPSIKKFTEKEGFDPTIIFQFKHNFYIETKTLASGGA